MRIGIGLLTLITFAPALWAQKAGWEPASGRITMPLWPHPQAGAAPEIDATTSKDRLVAGKPVIRLTNVSNPTITPTSP